MGNDGGSIPRRIELVKEKAKNIILNPDLERAAAWLYCALSKVSCSTHLYHDLIVADGMNQLLLEQPVVSDGLGKLYNQDAIIEYLLDPSIYGDGDKICSHITSLKDTTKLNLTPNPAYNEKDSHLDSTTMGSLDRDLKSKFVCPISMKEMNGKHRFVYLDTCGCVFAEQAMKEIPSKECVTVSWLLMQNQRERDHMLIHFVYFYSVENHLKVKMSLSSTLPRRSKTP